MLLYMPSINVYFMMTLMLLIEGQSLPTLILTNKTKGYKNLNPYR